MPLPLTVSCSSKIQIGFTFLVPAHPGSPGQRAVKRVCDGVCVCVNDIIAKMRLALFGHAHTYMYIHTNLYSGKNRENESEALAQDD